MNNKDQTIGKFLNNKGGKINKFEYNSLYKKSVEDNDNFWDSEGKRIDWIKPYTKIKNVTYSAKKVNIEWYLDKSLSIVQCSEGYPETYKINQEIKNLDKMILRENEFIFHAGTKIDNSIIVSNGGRVLNYVAKSNSFSNCREIVINLIKKIGWKKGFYRKDIGHKVIDK